MFIEHQANLGIACDGGFDRCFFLDKNGVVLLAPSFLEKVPGSTIIHDPRLTWNTIDVASRAGGRTVASKSGHAFIKQMMREATPFTAARRAHIITSATSPASMAA